MASKAVTKAAGGVRDIATKQTLQPTGRWERFRKAFALDPNRSSGVPLNPYFRNPTPGGTDPALYQDPVTVPAGDIADNPYWKRDSRRNYPRLSVVGQADAVALLTVGNKSQPKVELIGEAGDKALVAAETEGKEKGLAAFLASEKGVSADLLRNGLPPLPSGESLSGGKWDVHKYGLAEQSYSEDTPCRNFS